MLLAANWVFSTFKIRSFLIAVFVSAGCMRDVRLNGRYLPLDSQPRDGVSQVSVQGLFIGCPSDSCKKNQCSPPFICVDLWRVHECRYGTIQQIHTHLWHHYNTLAPEHENTIMGSNNTNLPLPLTPKTCVLKARDPGICGKELLCGLTDLKWM